MQLGVHGDFLRKGEAQLTWRELCPPEYMVINPKPCPGLDTSVVGVEGLEPPTLSILARFSSQLGLSPE